MQNRGGDSAGSPALSMRRARVDSTTLTLDGARKVGLKEETTIEAASETLQVVPKSYKDLWYLHGEYYDLTDFIASHPGGSAILLLSKGMEDATPVMESYHAFANKEYISKTMAKYKVNYVPKDVEQHVKPQTDYGFEKDGFYATLTRRVRAHFGSTKENESVTKRIKANKWWVFKVASQSVLFTGLYGAAFLAPGLDRLQSMGLAAAAGVMLIGVGMNAMHDGSHYAVGERDSWKNKLAMRIWNAVAFWDPTLWLYHHTIRHHAYTGDDKLDPDTMHANPAVRKHLDAPRKEYFSYFPRFLAVTRWFWTFWATLIYVLFPGMYSMQVRLCFQLFLTSVRELTSYFNRSSPTV
jgi:cytochrome b involved in lipid metabolism